MLEHTNKQFHSELETTRSMFLQMGGLVESMVLDGIHALTRGELQLVDRVREHERQVNQFEVDIDERISQLIARHQPTAGDGASRYSVRLVGARGKAQAKYMLARRVSMIGTMTAYSPPSSSPQTIMGGVKQMAAIRRNASFSRL